MNQLRLCLSPGEIKAGIIDCGQRTLIEYLQGPLKGAPGQISEEIKGIFSDSFFDAPFQKVSLVIDYPGNVLIPNALYQKQEERNYLSLVRELNPTVKVLRQNLPELDSKNVFCVPDKLLDVCLEKYPQSRIEHLSSLMIQEVLLQKGKDPNLLFCYKSADRLNLSILKEGNFTLFNHFEISSPEDALYYLLFCLEQQEMKADKCTLLFAGEEENKTEDYYNFLGGYFQDLRYWWNPKGISPAESMPENQKASYFPLLSATACE